MNRNLITFLFILLVTFSTINAIPHKLFKRTTEFGECYHDPETPPPTLISVTILPDPVVAGESDTFTVSGTLTEDLHPNIQVIVFFGDPSTGKIIDHITSQPVCDDQKNPCPKANTPFSTTVDVAAVPTTLPTRYDIVVGVIKKVDIYGCAAARVGAGVDEVGGAGGLPPASYLFL
ncbi:12842_t:CDS:1, partial [Entrophospora sp. SA101]